MSQSAVLVAALLAAFVLFVAARGRLASYGAVFVGQPAAQPGSGGSGSSGGGLGGTLKTVAGTAKTIGEISAFVGG